MSNAVNDWMGDPRYSKKQKWNLPMVARSAESNTVNPARMNPVTGRFRLDLDRSRPNGLLSVSIESFDFVTFTFDL